jgi:hypothetical protein
MAVAAGVCGGLPVLAVVFRNILCGECLTSMTREGKAVGRQGPICGLSVGTSRSPKTRRLFILVNVRSIGRIWDLAAAPHCNWDCPRMPKTVTPKASLAPRCHFRRVGGQVLSNGFYFSPDHWSGGAISSQNDRSYMRKHIIFIDNMLGHIFAWVYLAI